MRLPELLLGRICGPHPRRLFASDTNWQLCGACAILTGCERRSVRCSDTSRDGEIGRRSGLKIRRGESSVGVRFPLPAPSSPLNTTSLDARREQRAVVPLHHLWCPLCPNSAQTRIFRQPPCLLSQLPHYRVAVLLLGCHRSADVSLRNDGVALEYTPRFPAADFHDDAFSDSGPSQVSRRRSSRQGRHGRGNPDEDRRDRRTVRSKGLTFSNKFP